MKLWISVYFYRPPFADCITHYFQEKVPNVVVATNPFRIRYCTKNIVVFREDILTKLCRNSIYFPSNSDIPKEVCFSYIN